MEAAKKGEGGNFAALFSSDGSLNMAEFCEKISKRFVNLMRLCYVSQLSVVFGILLSQCLYLVNVCTCMSLSLFREAAFQELSVSTACLALLSGNYLAASQSKLTTL